MLVLAACTTSTDVPNGPDVTSSVEYKDIPEEAPFRADILFVVDDSPAMAPFQAKVRANLRELPDVLSAHYHVPFMHVGAITGDLADDGVMRTIGTVRGPFLVDEYTLPGDARVRNYRGSLADSFALLGDVGTRGSTTQQPLAAAVRALGNPRNAGFLRDDATLLVVVISASDDHSALPVHDLADQLKATKTDPAAILVANVFAQSDDTCAAPAPRLAAFGDEFSNLDTVSICSDDYTAVFHALEESYKQTLGAPCLDETPVDCEASDVQHPGTDDSAEQILPACGDGALPCWRLIPWDCGAGPDLMLQVDRVSYAPDGDHVILQCTVQ
jgi:hypothetical protein